MKGRKNRPPFWQRHFQVMVEGTRSTCRRKVGLKRYSTQQVLHTQLNAHVWESGAHGQEVAQVTWAALARLVAHNSLRKIATFDRNTLTSVHHQLIPPHRKSRWVASSATRERAAARSSRPTPASTRPRPSSELSTTPSAMATSAES
ncbi:hypothetical protein HYQ46_012278 [Verticillium longisporum]|nr:hypothetical protein HYQ46_012278 [Verticillium longisporum]